METATRTGNGEEYEAHFTAKIRKTPRPGGRPAPLPEVAGWQGRLAQHVLEDLGSICTYVQILDLPVLQMVEQPEEVDSFFRNFVPAVAEQVIEVPKLALPVCAVQRAALPEPQLVEQLVEVPTVLSVAVLQQRTAEQIVDNPVPHGVVELLVVFKAFSLDMWSRPLTFQLRAVVSGVFKVFSQHRVQHRFIVLRNAFLSGMWSRSLFLVVLMKTFKIFFQDRVHPLLLGIAEALDEPGEGFFRTFPQIKKSAKVTPRWSARVPRDVSSSTPAPQLEVSVEWVRLKDDKSGKPYYWNRRTFSTVWEPPPGVKVVWNGARNEEGFRYFWHSETRVSTFALPFLPPG